MIFSTHIRSLVGWMITPSSSIRSQMAMVSSVAGSSVARSLTNSTPRYSPDPCTAPINSCRTASSSHLAFRCPPTWAALACSLSSPITSRTVSPTTLETGLPPVEEKK